MKYQNMKQIARSAALSGLAALVLGCGGGGGTPNATETDGRALIRTRLMTDKNASRIVDFTEDPNVWINNCCFVGLQESIDLLKLYNSKRAILLS